MLLNTTERASRNGRGEDRDALDRRATEEEQGGTGQRSLPELLPPPSPRRPKFAAYVDSQLKPVRLSRAHPDVLTPRQNEAYRSGHAYLHFFPDGHTERALIHVGPDAENPGDDEQYSLLVHALTGRSKSCLAAPLHHATSRLGRAMTASAREGADAQA